MNRTQNRITTEDLNKAYQALGFLEVDKNEVDGVVTAEVEGVSTNANELEHTANTGKGAELIPVNVLSQQILDMVPEYSTFLSGLPGFHGTGLNLTEKVAVIGDVGFFQGNAEQTTGAQALPQARNLLLTGEILLTQAPLIADVFVTKRELRYSVAKLEEVIKTKLAKSFARTIESMIINGDSETGATGNVNSDDQAPATTFATSGGAADHRLLIDHGLRELAINGSFTVNAGTLDRSDFISVMNLLGDLASNMGDCAWLFNRQTYNKALGLDDFAKANDRGQQSTIDGKAVTNIFGADLYVCRDLGLSEADGKQSATPASNTKGQFLLVNKIAIQYGFGDPLELSVNVVPGRGIQITACADFGFGIAQLKAGETSTSVAAGINITV